MVNDARTEGGRAFSQAAVLRERFTALRDAAWMTGATAAGASSGFAGQADLAAAFVERSLDLLRPTIRKPGSELWFSWNPHLETDPIDVLLRSDPPPVPPSATV